MEIYTFVCIAIFAIAFIGRCFQFREWYGKSHREWGDMVLQLAMIIAGLLVVFL